LTADGANSPRSRKPLIVGIWILCIIGVAACVVLTGFPVIWQNLNDTIALLDAGWRIRNGQVPHREFYSVIGPFPLAVYALGFVFDSHSVKGFPLALLALGICFSALSWMVTRERLTPWWRLIVALQVLLLPVAAVYLGAGISPGSGDGPPFGFPFHTSYAMQHNRFGWAALVLQMIMMLIPRRSAESPRQLVFDALLAGFFLGLNVFCKINYLIGGSLLALWWIVSVDRRGLRVVGLASGLGLATLLLAVFPGGVFEYFLDQWRLLHVSRSESTLFSLLVRVENNWPWLTILCALHLWLLAGCAEVVPGEVNGTGVCRMSANFVAALAVTLFTVTFNTQVGEIPALLVVGLISIEMMLRARQVAEGRPGARLEITTAKFLAAKVCCAVLIASELCYDAGSVIYACAWKRSK